MSSFTIRMDPETKKALKRLAKHDERSQSAYVRRLIRREDAHLTEGKPEGGSDTSKKGDGNAQHE